MSGIEYLPILLGLAVLAPLASFVVIWLCGPFMGKAGKGAGHVATMAIITSAVFSFLSMGLWLTTEGHTPVAHDSSHRAEPFPDVNQADHAGEEHAPETGEHHPPSDQPVHPPETSSHDASSGLIRPVSFLQEAHAEGAEGVAVGEGQHVSEGGHDHHEAPSPYTGVLWDLGQFGSMRVSISYYIDSLTLTMFCMVTLIASCIHFYATGYMHDELHDFEDHEVTLSNGQHLHRPGRYHRFFQYLSLFCFSMLGLVYAGNIAMVFVFWELVGICSYFLIGFYTERQSASTAANKAFIVNRVGDFGMIIGLMTLWAGIGTFAFGDTEVVAADGTTHVERGLFSTVRPPENHHAFTVPEGMARLAARDELRGVIGAAYADDPAHAEQAVAAKMAQLQSEARESGKVPYGYWLMIVAGAGIFCGCVGKSAQFPLHTWLPDAMEGPTPVSALVHSATMVAAGVYLVGRFYPVFAPEVLLLIAVVGTITLFMAATIAIVATDIKRVLAYSTISQLGYMMLALGVGGWVAGLMHLITHAFFKSMLFMCSGSVIHAVHTNEMPQMGGLRRKMPYTAYTMLIGCLAISGMGLPFVVGFSGYYSKDSILEQAFSLGVHNNSWVWLFFWVAAGGAAITAFYMFRLWYLTFAGKPRDQHRYDHAHESPKVMYVPLLVLSAFAITVAWDVKAALYGAVVIVVLGLILLGFQAFLKQRRADVSGMPSRPFYIGLIGISVGIMVIAGLWYFAFENHVSLATLLQQSNSAGIHNGFFNSDLLAIRWPNEFASHNEEIAGPVTLIAFATAVVGILLATVFYCWNKLSPADVRQQFSSVYNFLLHNWYFDELYDYAFVKPTFAIAAACSWADRALLDRFINGTAYCVRKFSAWWTWLSDVMVVDGSVNGLAAAVYRTGSSLRRLQTGSIRQYIMFIALGVVVVFLLISMFRGTSFAG